MRLLLVDAHGLIHRAFHAIPPLSSQDGTPTNAIHGFFLMLKQSIDFVSAERVIACFDTPTPSFRKNLLTDYQSHRPPMLDEIKQQIPIIRNLLKVAGIASLDKPGYEADDIIGTLSQREKNKYEVYILTTDKDLLQLVDKTVKVLSPKIGTSQLVTRDEAAVQELLGIAPKLVVDYKALVGDPSDNYPGVKGIGPKTATKLLNEYGNLENLLNNLDKLSNKKYQTLIRENIAEIEISKRLAQIVCDLDLDCPDNFGAFTNFAPALKLELEKLQLITLERIIFPPEHSKQPTTKKTTKPKEQLKMF